MLDFDVICVKRNLQAAIEHWSEKIKVANKNYEFKYERLTEFFKHVPQPTLKLNQESESDIGQGSVDNFKGFLVLKTSETKKIKIIDGSLSDDAPATSRSKKKHNAP